MKKKRLDLLASIALIASMPKTVFTDELDLIKMRMQQDVDGYEEMIRRDEDLINVEVALEDADEGKQFRPSRGPVVDVIEA
jgi:hypothetical protein